MMNIFFLLVHKYSLTYNYLSHPLNVCPASVVNMEHEEKVLVPGINFLLLLSASHDSSSNEGMPSSQTGKPYFSLLLSSVKLFLL